MEYRTLNCINKKSHLKFLTEMHPKYNDEIPCEISWKKNELKKIFHEIPGGASRYISTFFGPRTT